ncbi:phage tail protein [Kitasatospora sp. NPDC048540]|uniref:phage tail protein n=1 Tax=unclassified Kitasatospora TaxID=2633591 RepID=UPI00053AB9F6|nr:phage tail protein [Kitasatospora sp. MBT63]
MTGAVQQEKFVPGITLRFQVTIEGLDLGAWKSCKGLTVSFKHKPIYEGGNYESPVSMLAEQLEYQTITLQRAIANSTSSTVQAYLKQVAASWFHAPSCDYRGGTGSITLYDASLAPVYTWNLRGVYPVKWAGPDLDAMGSGGVALETLELAHQGFL